MKNIRLLERDAVHGNIEVPGQYVINWIQFVQPSMRRLDGWRRFRDDFPILNSDSICIFQPEFQDFIDPAVGLLVSGQNLDLQHSGIRTKFEDLLPNLAIQRCADFMGLANTNVNIDR